MTTITDLFDRIESCYDAIPRVGGARVEDSGRLCCLRPRGPVGRTTPGPGSVHDAVTPRRRRRRSSRASASSASPEAIEWVRRRDPGAAAGRPGARPAGPARPAHGARPGRPAPPRQRTATAVAARSRAAGLRRRPGDQLGRGPRRLRRRRHRASARPARPSGTPRSSRSTPALLERVAAGTRRRATGPRPWLAPKPRASWPAAPLQAALGAAEIVGVATLPSARRRGLGAAVSALLARQALDTGHDLVFLAAADEDVARVYARIGFRRIGTACILELRAPTAPPRRDRGGHDQRPLRSLRADSRGGARSSGAGPGGWRAGRSVGSRSGGRQAGQRRGVPGGARARGPALGLQEQAQPAGRLATRATRGRRTSVYSSRASGRVWPGSESRTASAASPRPRRPGRRPGSGSAWPRGRRRRAARSRRRPTGKPNRPRQRTQLLAGLLDQVAGLGRVQQLGDRRAASRRTSAAAGPAGSAATRGAGRPGRGGRPVDAAPGRAARVAALAERRRAGTAARRRASPRPPAPSSGSFGARNHGMTARQAV